MHNASRLHARIPFWNGELYEVENLRGITVGPTDFQRRLQFVIAQAVDPGERISMKAKWTRRRLVGRRRGPLLYLVAAGH